MTAKDIQKALYSHFNTHAYRFLNTYFFQNESDFLSFTAKSLYAYDIEIKISKSDYKADFKKPRHSRMINLLKGVTHQCQKWGERKGHYSIIRWLNNTDIANRFYFAVPFGMITPDEVPRYAGLIYVQKVKHPYGDYEYWKCTVVKRAPLLHKVKHDPTKLFYKMYKSYESMTRRYLGFTN